MEKRIKKQKREIEEVEITLTKDELRDAMITATSKVSEKVGLDEVGSIGIMTITSAALFAEMTHILFDENEDDEEKED